MSGFAEDPRLGLYSPSTASAVSSEDLDDFVASAETHLPVFASGNPNNYGPGSAVAHLIPGPAVSTAARDWVNGDDGYDTVLSPGTAKNVLTVGSITDINFSLGTFGLSGFSGTGPTDDGRIKPDLAAVGQRNSNLGFGSSLFAAHKTGVSSYYNGIIPDSNNQVNLAGTSFAAPSVTGGLLLAEERRLQLLPGAGPLLASSWRAAAIHTAHDYGNPGPDYLTGWGLFHAERLVSLLEEDAALGRGTLIKEFTLHTGVAKSFFVHLPADMPAELTLAWSDPPGSPPPFATVLDDPTPMLVNELDLVVQDTASLADHLPWVLDPDLTGKSAASRAAAATRGTDDRNNVEKISVDAVSQVRRLKVTITPNGTLAGGSQKVSLILSGAIPEDPVITAIGFTQNPLDPDEYAITFSSDPGAYYTLQTTTHLPGATWTDVSSVQAEGSSTTILTTLDPDDSMLIWRVRRGQ